MAPVAGRVHLDRSITMPHRSNDSWPAVQGLTEYPAALGGTKPSFAGVIQIVARASWDPSKIASDELVAVHQGKRSWLCSMRMRERYGPTRWVERLS